MHKPYLMKKLISDILIFCSGADHRILESCKNERHKFYPIGLGVLITATLAFISMLFATNSIFGAKYFWKEVLLILFSIFWAIAIFSIDWGLVKTMKKRDLSTATKWEKTKSVFPVIFRLIVAIIISVSVSRPLETVIYAKRLKAQIEQDRQDFIRTEWEKKQKENADKFTNQIDANSKDIDKNNTEISNGPKTESYKADVASKSQCFKELESLKKTNSGKINSLAGQISDIRNSSNNYINGKMDDSAQSRITSLNRQIGNLRNEITLKEKQYSSYDAAIRDAERIHSERYVVQIATLGLMQNEYISAFKSKKTVDSIALKQINEASLVSFDPNDPGLITQLESMSNLEKTPQGKSVSLLRWVLLLLIICIDTAPIVIKVLTKRGPYEQLQEEENERLIFLFNHETYANKHLIQKLSIAQKEVLSEAITKWKNEEILRPDMSSSYINSNNQNQNEN